MDISHVWGSDLTLGPTGDLAQVDTLEEGRQRVIRRLLTALGAYIWQLDYGSGLPEMLGQPADPLGIEAQVRQQLAMEAAVAAAPEPTVTVTTDGQGGTLLTVIYTDTNTGAPVVLSKSLTIVATQVTGITPGSPGGGTTTATWGSFTWGDGSNWG